MESTSTSTSSSSYSPTKLGQEFDKITRTVVGQSSLYAKSISKLSNTSSAVSDYFKAQLNELKNNEDAVVKDVRNLKQIRKMIKAFNKTMTDLKNQMNNISDKYTEERKLSKDIAIAICHANESRSRSSTPESVEDKDSSSSDDDLSGSFSESVSQFFGLAGTYLSQSHDTVEKMFSSFNELGSKILRLLPQVSTVGEEEGALISAVFENMAEMKREVESIA
ncbi:MAG: hypothetical protein S4CHLAM20_12780 [Chlamydiia bacterium]|nr:hypothetical protein [Chlamydiia bacterium]